MSFEGKHFFSYILLTDQISLSGCLCFARYLVRCVLQLFVDQIVTSNFEINLIFLINPFLLHDQGEIKSIFKSFKNRAFIEANKTHFLEGERSTLT